MQSSVELAPVSEEEEANSDIFVQAMPAVATVAKSQEQVGALVGSVHPRLIQRVALMDDHQRTAASRVAEAFFHVETHEVDWTTRLV